MDVTQAQEAKQLRDENTRELESSTSFRSPQESPSTNNLDTGSNTLTAKTKLTTTKKRMDLVQSIRLRGLSFQEKNPHIVLTLSDCVAKLAIADSIRALLFRNF